MTLKNFRSLTIIVAALAVSLPAFSQEPVGRITQVLHKPGWYTEQAELWEEYLQTHPKDPQAWIEYYFAARYSNVLHKRYEDGFDLGAILEKAQKEIPGTYATAFLQYREMLGDMEAYKYLVKAHELNPAWTELYHGLMGYYLLIDQPKEAAEFGRKWLNSGNYSPGLLRWNYNMLMSCEPNALLITWGDNDTYPAWLLQHSMNCRKDIKVANLHLMGAHAEYRNRIFAEFGIPELENYNFNSRDAWTSLMDHITGHCRGPLYFGVGVSSELTSDLMSKLYTTGLAYKYSTGGFDNMEALKRNVEQRMLTDHFLLNVDIDLSKEITATMNANYLPAFIPLYKHYMKTGESDKALQMRMFIESIAKSSRQEKEVAEILDKN